MTETAAPEGSALQARAAATARGIEQYFQTRTDAIDRLVAARTDGLLGLPGGYRVSIAAVGGYGRRELFPHSDVDLLILVEDENAFGRIKDAVSDFTRDIWDSGAKLSQSVRTIAECCRMNEQNVELHISLLDLRFVAGDSGLFQSLELRVSEFYRQNGKHLARLLAGMARQRHSKFQNTVYHLEPNVKEGPGGIRDIHLLQWLTKLAPDKEVLKEAASEVAESRAFLAGVRAYLHVKAGRDYNLLTFEMQDDVAGSVPQEPVSPEDWMRGYYRQARSVAQNARRAMDFAGIAETSLLRQFRGWRERLSTADFTVSHEQVYLRNAATALATPQSALGLFEFSARHGLPLAWDTERKVRAKRGELEVAFELQPAPYSSWRGLFSQPHTALGVRSMEETGVLSAAVPGWKAIEALVVRDFYHRYTVDEHSLTAIAAIDELYSSAADGLQRFRDLAAQHEDVATLKLSLLLHDIGKGTTPGDHVRGSLDAAAKFLSAIKAPEDVATNVRFLIEHHLDLSSIMNARDLNDPATARYLAERVGTQENLRALVLFTYADISAVNPGAFTPWRAEQLWRVYTAGEERLTRELSSDRIHDASHSLGSMPALPETDRFLEGLPRRYALVHTAEQIAHHIALDEKRRKEGVAVEIAREPGAYRLTVVSEDQPGLFARLCGTLASYGMDILKAEAAANAAGCILDEFRFADPMRTLELNPDETGRLEWTIACVIRGAIQVPDLLKRRRPVPRPKIAPRHSPRVAFDDEASESSTLIEFVGEDRPGLLFDLASVLSEAGCNIELVLIDTEAHRAVDVFYVTHRGRKLSAAVCKKLEQDLIRAA